MDRKSSTATQANDADKKIEDLKELLFDDELLLYKKKLSDLKDLLNELDQQINTTDQFSKLIEKSKEDVIDILSPYFGKLMRKYIKAEITRMTDNINQTSKKLFSFGRLSSMFKKQKKQGFDQKLDIDHFFVIEKKSGLLMGRYSDEDKPVDADVVSGMLTAIKSFSEAAFHKKNEDLDTISYSGFELIMHSFERYYLVAVVDSLTAAKISSKLQDYFLEVAEKLIPLVSKQEITEKTQAQISSLLHQYFK